MGSNPIGVTISLFHLKLNTRVFCAPHSLNAMPEEETLVELADRFLAAVHEELVESYLAALDAYDEYKSRYKSFSGTYEEQLTRKAGVYTLPEYLDGGIPPIQCEGLDHRISTCLLFYCGPFREITNLYADKHLPREILNRPKGDMSAREKANKIACYGVDVSLYGRANIQYLPELIDEMLHRTNNPPKNLPPDKKLQIPEFQDVLIHLKQAVEGLITIRDNIRYVLRLDPVPPPPLNYRWGNRRVANLGWHY